MSTKTFTKQSIKASKAGKLTSQDKLVTSLAGSWSVIKTIDLDVGGKTVTLRKIHYNKYNRNNKPINPAAGPIRGWLIDENDRVVITTFGYTPISLPVGELQLDGNYLKLEMNNGSDKPGLEKMKIDGEIKPYIEGNTLLVVTANKDGGLSINTHTSVSGMSAGDSKTYLSLFTEVSGLKAKKLFVPGKFSSTVYYFLLIRPENSFCSKRRISKPYMVYVGEKTTSWFDKYGAVPGIFEHTSLPVDKVGPSGYIAPTGTVRLPSLNGREARQHLLCGYQEVPDDIEVQNYINDGTYDPTNPLFMQNFGETLHIFKVDKGLKPIRVIAMGGYMRPLVSPYPDAYRSMIHNFAQFEITIKDKFTSYAANFRISNLKPEILDECMERIQDEDGDVRAWYTAEDYQDDPDDMLNAIKKDNPDNYRAVIEKLVFLQFLLCLPPHKYYQFKDIKIREGGVIEAIKAETADVLAKHATLFLFEMERYEKLDETEMEDRSYTKDRRYKVYQWFKEYTDPIKRANPDLDMGLVDLFSFFEKWVNSMDINSAYTVRKELLGLVRKNEIEEARELAKRRAEEEDEPASSVPPATTNLSWDYESSEEDSEGY
uniref:Uncharacterized protein n=1 Tax=viral metagenome TaxID=1070528 RepID=A0A6C0JSG7_9ZZZZ